MPRTSPVSPHRLSGDGSPSAPPQPDRLASLEAAVAAIQHTLDVQFQRLAEMQVMLDRLTASNGKTKS
jgi:hypothetical protein